MINVNLLLFEDFETLDLFGPVEILGRVETYQLNYCSLDGGIVRSKQGVQVVTHPMEDSDEQSILLLPGGQGTRVLINNERFITALGRWAAKSAYCLTVCTGAALLARTGLLKKRAATSNKKAFAWVRSLDEEVCWIEKARWVVDGKYYTSSGVSAGIDMALGFVSDRLGKERAEAIARHIEYVWNADRQKDPFVCRCL